MSEVEVQSEQAHSPEEPHVPRESAPPIESRFLYVDVAALRAKQLRRGAKNRLDDEHDHARPTKPERVAMQEVRNGLVAWDLPDFKAVFDTR